MGSAGSSVDASVSHLNDSSVVSSTPAPTLSLVSSSATAILAGASDSMSTPTAAPTDSSSITPSIVPVEESVYYEIHRSMENLKAQVKGDVKLEVEALQGR